MEAQLSISYSLTLHLIYRHHSRFTPIQQTTSQSGKHIMSHNSLLAEHFFKKRKFSNTPFCSFPVSNSWLNLSTARYLVVDFEHSNFSISQRNFSVGKLPELVSISPL